MSETRKLTTILAADVAGYSRLAAADEERTLARLRALRGDLVDPAISIHHGRVVKRTGDGFLVEFRSPVEAVRCAIEVQDGMAERNAGLPPDRRIEFRVAVHLGDVVEEADGDLMGDAVNIAARIEGIADPGGIFVSRAAHEQIDGKITERFIDLGEKELKNIPKAVRVFALTRSREAAAPASQRASAPPRLSIVVLPFTNIGGHPEQEYFVDGVTESLTTDLSRLSGSFVIARNTAFTYRGKPVDVKQIGRDLNIRYVLEGSVQRGGDRLRINVQLIEAETGAHLWAERFDKPLADLFKMQDEIVARLANQLNTALITVEARRAEKSPSPDAMDLYFQGMARSYKSFDPTNLNEARRFFERALAIEPDFVEAMIGAAWIDCWLARLFASRDAETRLAAAETAANRALSISPDHAAAHAILGVVYATTGRASLGITECEYALALDRNFAMAHAIIGGAKNNIARGEETEGHILEALRLSPRDVQAFQWMWLAGNAKLYVGRDEEAVMWLRRSIDANRNFSASRFSLAAALAHLGKIDEAKAEAQQGLKLNPGYTIGRLRAAASNNDPTYLDRRERAIKGMLMAGVPEGEPEKPAAPRLSIVVLPFVNIGGDPEQEYFVDGVTESLTTDLSRISGSFVIARNTAFTYKGKPIDVKEIGRELNVRYVLEGSVQRGGNRMRVNVQLIDSETGNHLWAERFDKPVADLLDMQDEIVARLARKLNAELIAAEARRSQSVPDPDSLDFTFRGLAALNRGRSRENLGTALEYFNHAISLDPHNVDALVGEAWTRARFVTALLTDDRAGYLVAGKEAATKALQLAPNHASAHVALGYIFGLSGQGERSVFEFECALTLDGNEAHAHAGIGATKITVGRADEAEGHILEALRLSPRDTQVATWFFFLGASKLYLAQDADAVSWLQRSIDADRNYAPSHFYLAAAMSYLNRLEEARDAVAAGLALRPEITIDHLRDRFGAVSDNPVYLTYCDRAYDGMRKAGVPEA